MLGELLLLFMSIKVVEVVLKAVAGIVEVVVVFLVNGESV